MFCNASVKMYLLVEHLLFDNVIAVQYRSILKHERAYAFYTFTDAIQIILISNVRTLVNVNFHSL